MHVPIPRSSATAPPSFSVEVEEAREEPSYRSDRARRCYVLKELVDDIHLQPASFFRLGALVILFSKNPAQSQSVAGTHSLVPGPPIHFLLSTWRAYAQRHTSTLIVTRAIRARTSHIWITSFPQGPRLDTELLFHRPRDAAFLLARTYCMTFILFFLAARNGYTEFQSSAAIIH